MTTQKAAEVLRELCQYWNGKKEPPLTHSGTDQLIALEMAIECLSAMRWIPVSERMPERGQQVYVIGYREAELYTAAKEPSVGSVNWNTEKLSPCSDTCFYSFGYTNITHWMPIPATPIQTDYCPCTPDETTGEMSDDVGKTINPSAHSRLNTPTDEQIGEIFERYADRYVYDNPYTIRGYWHYTAMTRTAAIKFAKEILLSLKTQI